MEYDNLSEATRSVLSEATEIAREMSHEQVEPEHLLLALLTCDDASIAAVFSTDVRHAMQSALRDRMTPGTEFLTRGKLLASPSGQRVLQTAVEIAGAGFVSPRHLLIALVQSDESIARSSLLQFGITEESIVNAAVEDRLQINGTSAGLVRTIVDSAAALPYRESPDDGRLYLPRKDNWVAQVKGGWEKEYCYLKNPGEDYFHLLLSGEIYLQRNDEKYCLNCARRMGLVTHDRLHWQHRKRETSPKY